MADVYTVEIDAWDPATSGIVRLRYATRGFASLPTDTPPHAFFDERLEQPATITRSLFSEGATSGRSKVGYGDIVLANGDGLLDALLTYGFDGRSVTIRRGALGAAYPAGFTTVAELTAEQVEATTETIVLKVRDRQLELEVPLQPTKYAGDNVPPDGLEGGPDDLLGKPKPRCFGVVKNVPAVLVNAAKLIYQVNDGPIASLDAVYDRGILLSGGTWPTATAFGSNFDVIYSCTYGNGLYLMGGEDNTVARLATSPNGVDWTLRASAELSTSSWRSIAWAPEITTFVAVGFGPGGNSAAISSPDGATWTSRTLNWTEPAVATSVAWGSEPALFVAVGVGGRLATSPTGTTWTSRTSGTANDINEVTYGDGLFVAVASGGVIVTSPDGITWTVRGDFGGGTLARSVTAGFSPIGHPMFVAVGDGGTLATSLDGTTWVTRLTGTSSALYSISFSGQQFLAVGASGVAIASVNGVAWTLLTTNWGAGNIQNVCWGPFGWLIVGDNQQYAISTYDRYDDADELESDSLVPAPGEVKWWPDGGYFRLGASPAGFITADVTEGATAGDRTTAQIFARLLTHPLGAPLGEVSADDLDALDTANAAILGLWMGPEELTVAEAATLVASSVGAWWAPDRLGVFRIQQFTAPSGAAVLALTANDLKGQLERIPVTDVTRGLPAWRTLVRYARNHVVQDTDLAAGVADDRRAFLAREWREATVEDAAVLLAHPRAPETLDDALLTTEADADAEATRRQALRGVQRDRYRVRIPWDNETDAVDLGQVVTLAHTRYGLGAGPSFRVVLVEPDARDRTLTLDLWK